MDGVLERAEATEVSGLPVPGGSGVQELLAVLDSFRVSADSNELIDQIRGLEDAKSAIAALQARAAVAFDLAQRREQTASGVPSPDLGQGVGAQIALARRESPNRGSRLLGLAKALVSEMPRTMAALETGQLNEWRATIPWHNGGPTSLANSAGLCEACNHTKENPGRNAKTIPGSRHHLEISTPTGHTYQSKAPPLPANAAAAT
ncbi:hypothetical protein StoSoilA2_01260 [Arthrobacter sp. StoSoilA2]|uniref:HNH endonuclease n=1 Tax=Arthrobacter sp. StoSoilA2 TaxID=2830990 RepID=UPI001CC5BFA7|nr:HNH endonuclease [Arthrobacter sp. StoSoilA2]BCW34070.1 hypothetical protein StoSoilA2_01260 [Arthrobacter sp. StoSoilA2]